MTPTTERLALAIAWGDAPETEEIRIVCKTPEAVVLRVNNEGFLLAETSGGGHFSIPSIPEIEANIREYGDDLRVMSLNLIEVDDADRKTHQVYLRAYSTDNLDEGRTFAFIPQMGEWFFFDIDEDDDQEADVFWVVGDD